MARVIYADYEGKKRLEESLKKRLTQEGIEMDVVEREEACNLSGLLYSLYIAKKTGKSGFGNSEEICERIFKDKLFNRLGHYSVLLAHLGSGVRNNSEFLSGNFPNLRIGVFSEDPQHYHDFNERYTIFGYHSSVNNPSTIVEFIKKGLEEVDRK